MSEIIKEFKKGDLLHIDKDRKAQWGFPEGYPYKEDGVTIEWNGNTEDLFQFDFFFKVSDIILSNEEIKRGTITISNQTFPIREAWDSLVQQGMVSEDVVLLDRIVLFIRKDNAVFNGYIMPEHGVYFHKGSDSFTSKFTNEATHPIAAELLPTATTTAAGTVKQAAVVANVTAAPTAEEFNALLKSLRDAGILATS